LTKKLISAKGGVLGFWPGLKPGDHDDIACMDEKQAPSPSPSWHQPAPKQGHFQARTTSKPVAWPELHRRQR